MRTMKIVEEEVEYINGFTEVSQNGSVEVYTIEEVEQLADEDEYILCRDYVDEDVVGFVVDKQISKPDNTRFVQLYNNQVF